MSLREALETQDLVFTGEIGPPKGIDCHELWEEAEDFRGVVSAVNVTDAISLIVSSMFRRVICSLVSNPAARNPPITSTLNAIAICTAASGDGSCIHLSAVVCDLPTRAAT